MYRPERIQIETGRLVALMATPPAPHHWAPMLRDLLEELPQLREGRELLLQNLPCPDASHFRKRTGPMTAPFLRTLAISAQDPDETAIGHASFRRCR